MLHWKEKHEVNTRDLSNSELRARLKASWDNVGTVLTASPDTVVPDSVPDGFGQACDEFWALFGELETRRLKGQA